MTNSSDFFRSKTAIVTGGSSGIGRALALALADRQCRVVVTGRNSARLEAVIAELTSKGVEAGGYIVDHSKLSEVEAFADSFFSEWGEVDILCSNAGVAPRCALFGEYYRRLEVVTRY